MWRILGIFLDCSNSSRVDFWTPAGAQQVVLMTPRPTILNQGQDCHNFKKPSNCAAALVEVRPLFFSGPGPKWQLKQHQQQQCALCGLLLWCSGSVTLLPGPNWPWPRVTLVQSGPGPNWPWHQHIFLNHVIVIVYSARAVTRGGRARPLAAATVDVSSSTLKQAAVASGSATSGFCLALAQGGS
jgi:hypothetical protein